ncbi:MAG: sulfurtransferase TusA family protein [Nitrospirota bacterium]|nr:sulfurtransferase TusA family protein [Nitrospirota bacterium]
MAIKFEKISDGSYTLDCTGYVCPHPQIYTKKMLEKIGTGSTLEVTFDNPSSGESITAMCSSLGNEIVERSQQGGKYIYKIKKSA